MAWASRDRSKRGGKKRAINSSRKRNVTVKRMYSQRFENKSSERDERQSGNGSTNCESVPVMSVLRNDTVSETYSSKQKSNTSKMYSTTDAGWI